MGVLGFVDVWGRGVGIWITVEKKLVRGMTFEAVVVPADRTSYARNKYW